MPKRIEVIDLFAGPGGLGEGFSAFANNRRSHPFHISMSVEKEASAHKTLELRAFVRQFPYPPDAYYEYVRGELSREALFARFAAKAEKAREETLYGPKELGPSAGDDKLIYERLAKLKKTKDGPWIVIGGPPCQAYSLVGRARNRGIAGYQAEDDHRHFLYEEYLKVLGTVRPEVFVMENVKGILSSRVNGKFVFPKLLQDLRCPDASLKKRVTRTSRYKIYSLVDGVELDELTSSGSSCVIRSEEYGVPQTRHRVILLGVREDIAASPRPLERESPYTPVGELLKDFPTLRSGLSKEKDSASSWGAVVAAQEKAVRRELRDHGLNPHIVTDAVRAARGLTSRGGQFVRSRRKYHGPAHLADWLPDPQIGGFLNHETRGHMVSDLARYLYCACYAAQKDGVSPRSRDFPEVFAPNHDSWESGKFADRFKVQAEEKPAGTITSHISKDGHYYIHYDPAQCRSLTVREAARLQTFPDNYFFEGNRTQQYVQVGNAVPPWLATQIASIVYDLIT